MNPGLLETVTKRGGAKLGIAANVAAHTNELIGGVVLAVQDINYPVELIWRDDRRDAEAARVAARSLVGEGVAAVVGHLSASAALPASEIYADAGVVFLAPGTTHPGLTERGGGCIFRLCGRDDDQAELIADFIARLPRHDLIGVIEQDIAYGHKLAALLRAAMAERGLRHLTFRCGEQGLSQGSLDDLARARIDVVAFAGIHEAAAVCCRQLEKMSCINSIVLGDDGFTPNLLTLAGAAAAGANVIAPGPAQNHDAKAVELVHRYTRLVGVEPGAYFLTSYAATWIVLSALAAGNGEARHSLPRRLRGQVWHTPAGHLQFDQKGEVQGLGWTAYRIADGRFVPQRTFGACKTREKLTK